MGNQDILQYIMIGILLLCGYLFLFQTAARRTENRGSVPMVAIILLLIYLLITVPLLFIIGSTGSTDMILLAILLLFACVAVFFALYGLVRNFREINKGMLVLFLLYLMMVGYITIFSRAERRTNEVLLSFDSIEEAIRMQSLEPLEHLWLNIVMFVPIGVLFPLIYEGLNKWIYVFPLGLMLTTMIETTQLLLRLGQCDLEDLVANTLGACLGLVLYRLYRRFRPE